MRGQVLTFDADTGGGLISGDDGNRYAFSGLDVRGAVPAAGAAVDFVPAEGYAREVIALASAVPMAAAQFVPGSVDYTGEDLSLWGYFVRCITGRYADGNGRARRKEYWGFTLFSCLCLFAPVLIGLLLSLAIDPNMTSDAAAAPFGLGITVCLIASLGLMIPNVTVMVRRLHDVGMSGWLWLMAFVPFGSIFLLVVAFMPSEGSTNAYGPIPTPRPPSAI